MGSSTSRPRSRQRVFLRGESPSNGRVAGLECRTQVEKVVEQRVAGRGVGEKKRKKFIEYLNKPQGRD